jgi:uroporphyrin-3 C-methyltransferase
MAEDDVKETLDEAAEKATETAAGEAAGDAALELPTAVGPGPGSGLVPKLAIVVAIIAIVIAGALWWQYRAFYVSLRNEDAGLLENIEDARATLRRLDDEIESVRGELTESAAARARMSNDLAAVPAELRAVNQRVDALQGGRLDARDSWLKEQARYYLVLANSELNLGRRVDTAIEALDLADDVLRELGDPALGQVRSAIASEQQALRAVELPDLEGLSVELASLAASAPELPMRAAPPDNFGAPDESLDESEPGLGRLWARTKGALRSIVRVERQDEPVAQVLSESERRVVRRQLALELDIARAAVLDRRQDGLQASLEAADGILSRDFDRSAQSIIEARRMLAQMMQVELEPRLPDISDSLTLLRNASGAD